LNPKEAIQEANQIYKKYTDFYGPELVQGAALLIAEEMANKLNTNIMSGILHINGEMRAHYWCIKQGTVLDPIFHKALTVDPRAYKDITDGGKRELYANIERYRLYQV